jgi:outer membrane protein OmpU
MKNLKKIGLSALAGSLAITSASAVDYSVTGDAIINYVSKDSNYASAESLTGTGMHSQMDLYFNASGELDNGWTVSFFQGVDTTTAWSNSSSQATLGMGSLGTLQFNAVAGSKANGIDDVTPFAFDEAWGTSTDRPDFFGASTASGSIDYRIPAQEMMGATVNASFTYDPASDEAQAGERAANTTNNTGTAYTLQIAHESGLEIGGGIENVDGDSADEESATGYVKYAYGPISVGYQESYQNSINKGQDLEAEMMGIAYTAGDLTVSWSEQTLTTNNASAAAVESELEAIQAAYTMGAMTISASIAETSNAAATAGNQLDHNELQVSFAF